MRKLLPTLLSAIILLLFTACGDKSTGPEELQGEKLTKSMAVTAVMEVFKERGLYHDSSGQSKAGNMSDRASNVLSFGKYYDVDLDLEGGRVDVTFDVGPDGNIIPDGDWRDNNPDFCREKIRYMKGAQKQLNYKVFPFNDGWDVFVQYIDVPTSEIENQREGQSPDPNLEGLKDAINNAMDNFEPDVKPAGDGCGKKFPLKFVLTSTTKIEGVYDPQTGTNNNIVVKDEVNLEVALSYNDQLQAYQGSGKISWSNYDASFPESPNTSASCQLPNSQVTNIPQFYDGTADSLKQGDKVLYVQPQGWSPLATCTVTYPDGSSITQNSFFKAFPVTWSVLEPPHNTKITQNGQSLAVYEVKNWKDVSGNDDIIARRVYDRNETADTLGFKNYTEQTTMEIRRRSSSN